MHFKADFEETMGFINKITLYVDLSQFYSLDAPYAQIYKFSGKNIKNDQYWLDKNNPSFISCVTYKLVFK